MLNNKQIYVIQLIFYIEKQYKIGLHVPNKSYSRGQCFEEELVCYRVKPVFTFSTMQIANGWRSRQKQQTPTVTAHYPDITPAAAGHCFAPRDYCLSHQTCEHNLVLQKDIIYICKEVAVMQFWILVQIYVCVNSVLMLM